MAERRMMTKKVTDDDNFMQLSASAQALYLHLTMSADDDGFCNQVSICMFKAHASIQDLQSLLERRYIYQFENGVIVIKHWRMANALRKDRYTPTAFQEELAQLKIKGNGSYTWLPDGCQTVAACLPQDRIGKDRLDKVSKDKDIDDSGESVSCQQIVDLYNSICVSFPSVRSLSEARRKAIKARLKNYSLEDFQTVFTNAENSSFLKGSNDRNWSANFDWLIADKNMAKVLEGNYADKPKRFGRKEPVPGWMQPSLGDAELEAIQQVLKEPDPELADRAEKLRQSLQGV